MNFEDPAATPVDVALQDLTAVFAQLLEAVEAGGLDAYDNLQLVGFAQTFEQFRNRLALVDHRLIRHGLDRDLPQALTQTSIQRVLSQALRISPAEASRRVRAAESVGARTSMLGEPLSPVRPVLAAAQRSGEVNAEQVDIIVRGLAKVDRPGYDPADLQTGETLLTRHALTFGPLDLRLLTQTVIDRIDPDGSRPQDELNDDRRHLELRACPDGSFRGEFRLTGPVGAKLVAILGPLAKPRTNLTISPDGRLVDNLDGRTHGQRMHDALGDACDRLLRAGGLPDTGGTPTTLLVTISHEDLLARTGHGTTSDGTQLPARQVLELADQADIIPTVLNQSGAVLALGRTRRIASPGQTLALIARDGGCSFPGCSHPPDYCERHHIKPWFEGGLTNLDNLTLLCRYHHHNFAIHGWTCQINRDGLPIWTAPAWIDRSRTPMINQRIQSQVLRRELISA